MKRLKKLLILLLVSLSVIIIYTTNEKTPKIYLVLGDSYSMGINSYGGITYGYEDYLKDFFNTKEKTLLIDNYTSKNKNIISLKNDILENNTIVVDKNSINIRKELSHADYITILIGLNDLIYEYNIDDNINSYQEDKIVDYTFNKLDNLLKEIKKYRKEDIYVLTYPESNTKYNSLINKYNNKIKKQLKSKYIVIDNTKILDKNTDYDMNSLYPNTNGYRKIAKNIQKNIR